MNKEIVKKLKDSLDYEFDLSFNERKELLSYIEQLEKIPNKALNFIKENSYKKGDGTIMYDVDIQELEDILRGGSE